MFRTYFLLSIFFATLGLGACSSAGRDTASDKDETEVYRPKGPEVRGTY